MSFGATCNQVSQHGLCKLNFSKAISEFSLFDNEAYVLSVCLPVTQHPAPQDGRASTVKITCFSAVSRLPRNCIVGCSSSQFRSVNDAFVSKMLTSRIIGITGDS